MTSKVGGQQLRYRLRPPLPKKVAVAGAAQSYYPLLLFLHGAGERGSDLEMVDRHGPARLRSEIDHLQTCYLLSPQCPAEHWWRTDTLLTLLEEVIERDELRVDHSRIYLTGLSMGGYATWKILSENPDRFAAAVPICGGGEPKTLLVPHSMLGAQRFDYAKVKKAANTPIWAFHGTADPVVPVDESRKLVNSLHQAGNRSVRLTEYEGMGHDCWTTTYQIPELYEWMFKHHLKTSTAYTRDYELRDFND